MKKILLTFISALLIGCNTTAPKPKTITVDGEPEGPHTSVEWKIWAYSTAAPSFIAANCTVVDNDGTVLREGTNGWTAMSGNMAGPADPENGYRDRHEAISMVGDAESFNWMKGYMDKTKPEMNGDGWIWMLHGDSGVDNFRPYSEGDKANTPEGAWIESGPHLMLMPKDPSTLDGQTTDFNTGSPYVMFEGTDYAHLMIPTEGYYDYQDPVPSIPNLENSNVEPDAPHTSAEWKIWAYSTAAPSFIAANCTVVDMDADGNQIVLREGTNGWTAMAANPRGPADPENGWKDPHEAMPMVGDALSFAWVSAYFAGTKPKTTMDSDGWAWMLHGDMGEDNTKAGVLNKEDSVEGAWIESGPHLMLMPKDPSTLDGQTTDFNKGAPYVMFAGTDYAHLMIPVEGYYDYQDPK